LSENTSITVKKGRRTNDELGLITKKITIPIKFLTLIEVASDLNSISIADVLKHLERDLLAASAAGQKTMRINPIFLEAWTTVKERMAAAELAEVDVSRLEVSRVPRSSGYVGVYCTQGGQFIIHGKDPASQKTIPLPGKFLTAEGAAWARYQHYKTHGLPYGKLEAEIIKVQGSPHSRYYGGKLLPDHWAKAVAIWNLAVRGIILPDLDDADRRWETTNPVTDLRYGED
jgi:hypothetical protein